jgi:D-alanyl-lipoteichoic acid acyltransferase DltB (MBOAT superfamily)
MSWKIEYAFLILASTITVYIAGILIEKYKDLSIRKWVLIVTLLFNLGILFLFKYYNFFNDSLRIAFNQFNLFYNAPTLKLLLPVGISFYTFQILSYLIDVYKGKQPAERHFGHFAVFVAFFPKLISGPIERAKNLLPQFYEKQEFSYQGTTDGLKLIAWGLFQKVVVADRLAIYVDQVYNNPGQYTGAPVVLATVFYAFQVYCDFSGYSDMAIGSGRVLGFRLMKNFDRPFHAKSISDFWRRWHISLSSWLYDYIYTPILINRRDWGQAAVVFSLFVTFVACGLWHGANWTFVVFGLLHGFVLSLEAITKKDRKKFRKMVPKTIYNNISLLLTFSFVCFTLVFFRANNISDAFLLISNMVSIDFTDLNVAVPQMTRIELLLSFLSIAILVSMDLFKNKVQIQEFIAKNILIRWSLYIVFLSYILFFRKTGAEFIYLQF